jgi:hypothetical protein
MLPRQGDRPGDGLLVSVVNGAAADNGIVVLRVCRMIGNRPAADHWAREVKLFAPE